MTRILNWENTFSIHNRMMIFFETLISLLPHLDVDKIKSILDLGCSFGISTYELASLFPNASVVGIDIQESMINHNNGHIGRYTAPKTMEKLAQYNDLYASRVKFIVGDMFNPPVIPGWHDLLIVANNILFKLENLCLSPEYLGAQLLKPLQLLNEGGYMILYSDMPQSDVLRGSSNLIEFNSWVVIFMKKCGRFYFVLQSRSDINNYTNEYFNTVTYVANTLNE